MFRINSVNSINSYSQLKTSFKGSTNQTNPQINQLDDVKPDFAVKTPIEYKKIGEIDFPYDTKAHFYKLANGQQVVIVPQEGETLIKTYVNTGSMNEPDKIRGISHYIEHNLFNGSEGLEDGDFFKQVNKMGASTNASTGFAETNYYISSNLLNDGDLEKKIKLHASMLETPLFAIEKLEKEKGIVNSEINMITSNPTTIAVNKMLKNLYNIKTSSQDMIGGTCENINNLTREDVINYYNNNYYPANMVTVITGEVDPQKTIELISKNFTSRKQLNPTRYNEKLTPIDKTIREDIISDKATATTIILGFNGPSSDNTKEGIYAEALGILLAKPSPSRVNNKLKKLNSSVSIDSEKISTNSKDGRALIFSADSVEENSEKVLKTIFNEIGNIENNPPSEQEMQIIKKSMLKACANTYESSAKVNNIIGRAILENNKDYLTDYEKIVKEMTPEDLVNTAKKYFNINKASVTIVHPANATEESIKQNHNNAISFTGAKKEAINMSQVSEYDTCNNYRVITLNSKTDNVNILYKLELDDEIKAPPGARFVLSRLLNRGSIYRDKENMSTELAQNGINNSFSVDNSMIVCDISCDRESIGKAFDTMKETLYNPRFTQEEFELAKNQIKDDIITSEKSVYDKLEPEIYKGISKSESREDVLKSLDNLTLNDIKYLYSSLLQKSKGIISVSAPFEREKDLKNTIMNNISNLASVQKYSPVNETNIYEPVERTKVLTDIDNKNQADIVQAYKFKASDNIKDQVTIELLNEILGGSPSSRLFMDLREKEKLCYRVKSFYSKTYDIGVMELKIGTTTDNKETGEVNFDNIKKSIDGFNKHTAKLKSEKVSDEELNNAKLALKNAVLSINQNSADKNTTLAKTSRSPYGINKENLFYKTIDSITAEDIQNAAKYIFSNKPVYSILATEDTINANKDYLKSLEMDS